MMKFAMSLLGLAIVCVAFWAGSYYPGSWQAYLLFTVVANALLFRGFQRTALFFDTFIGVFFWLGFWLKLSVGLLLGRATFLEALSFDRSPAAYDHALAVSSCGLAAFLAASLIRGRFFAYPRETVSCAGSGLYRLYSRHRYLCVAAFLLIVIAVTVSNVWLGLYQRGMVARTVLPYGLSGVYKWLLQFGLASVSALIIRFEIEMNRNLTAMAVIPALLENFLSNASLLSRGMILNAAGLAVGGLRLIRAMSLLVSLLRVAALAVGFVVLFAVSVLAVNVLRATAYQTAAVAEQQAQHGRVAEPKVPSVRTIRFMTMALFVERWVGLEGVVAVSSSNLLGWDLWREAWRETLREDKLSLYDSTFIDTPYTAEPDDPKFHFISLPGIVAFFYYPGSLAFLFAALVGCAWLAAAFEIATYRYAGHNIVLCSLFAQVLAARFAHFGYVPAQSYLLLGSLLLNIAIFYLADRGLRRYFAEPAEVAGS